MIFKRLFSQTNSNTRSFLYLIKDFSIPITLLSGAGLSLFIAGGHYVSLRNELEKEREIRQI